MKESGHSLIGTTDKCANNSDISSSSISMLQSDLMPRKGRHKKTISMDKNDQSPNKQKEEVLVPRYTPKHAKNADSVDNHKRKHSRG